MTKSNDIRDHGDGSADHGKANEEHPVPPDDPGKEPAWSKAGKDHPDNYRMQDDTWIRVGPDGHDADD